MRSFRHRSRRLSSFGDLRTDWEVVGEAILVDRLAHAAEGSGSRVLERRELAPFGGHRAGQRCAEVETVAAGWQFGGAPRARTFDHSLGRRLAGRLLSGQDCREDGRVVPASSKGDSLRPYRDRFSSRWRH